VASEEEPVRMEAPHHLEAEENRTEQAPQVRSANAQTPEPESKAEESASKENSPPPLENNVRPDLTHAFRSVVSPGDAQAGFRTNRILSAAMDQCKHLRPNVRRSVPQADDSEWLADSGRH
jgi:hypothetical protein